MTSGVWRAAARDIGREKREPLAPPSRRAGLAAKAFPSARRRDWRRTDAIGHWARRGVHALRASGKAEESPARRPRASVEPLTTQPPVPGCRDLTRPARDRRLFPATGRSLDLLRQLARLPQQGLQPPALLDRFARISPMRLRILVAAGSARSRRAAMHPAAFLPARRRSPAGRARTRLGAATSARQHGAGVGWTIVRHLFPHAALSAGAGCCSPMIVIAGRRELPSAGGVFAGASGARAPGSHCRRSLARLRSPTRVAS